MNEKDVVGYLVRLLIRHVGSKISWSAWQGFSPGPKSVIIEEASPIQVKIPANDSSREGRPLQRLPQRD
jgi:hypothetical protein